MTPNFVGVAGLPRSGSTLLCQMLDMHPEIACEGFSSPLCNLILALRRLASNDPFMLSQLDTDFAQSYGHLNSAMEGFLRGWYKGKEQKVVVDKNRAWLHCIELLLKLAPEARLIVTIRELGQVYGSIEANHQKTILLDFKEHLADFDRFGRVDMLFAKDHAIGMPLISLHAVPDLPLEVQKRLYFLRFEDFMDRPVSCMSHIYEWLGVSPFEIDPTRLQTGLRESDSHYCMKYPHSQQERVMKPKRHEVPPRIQARIQEACAWYYQMYYPEQASGLSR